MLNCIICMPVMAICWIAEEVQTLAVAWNSCVCRDARKNYYFLSFNIANWLTFEEISYHTALLPGPKINFDKKKSPTR